LEFDNNAVANVTASRVSSRRFRRIRVFGAESYQALNYIDQQIEVVRKTEPRPGQKFPGLETEMIQVAPRLPLDAELEHFVRVIRNNTQPLVNGHDGLKALRVAEQVKAKIDACVP
jgi:predicted dehydrogenase